MGGCASTGIALDDAGVDAGLGALDSAFAMGDAFVAVADGSVEADAGPADGRCFPDVELATVRGARIGFSVQAVLPHAGGWVVVYSWGGSDSNGTAVAFVDAAGRLVATEDAPWARGGYAHVVMGRFVMTWRDYAPIQVHEIGGGTLIARDDAPGPRAGDLLLLVRVGADGTLRILSRRDAALLYTELTVDDPGSFSAREGTLPSIESLGSDSLEAHVARVGFLPWRGGQELGEDDTLTFAFPVDPDLATIGPRPWHLVRVQLELSTLGGGRSLGWRVLDETRWEEGPISVFGVLPELGVAVAGRFMPTDTREPAITVEPYLASATLPPRRLHASSDSETLSLGGTYLLEREGMVALVSPGYFRVFTRPALEEVAAAAMTLINPRVAWGDEVVAEVGYTQRRVEFEDEIVGTLRCHELTPSR